LPCDGSRQSSKGSSALFLFPFLAWPKLHECASC